MTGTPPIIHRSLDDLPRVAMPSIVTVGNFDGVHCGHRTVIAEVVRRAGEIGARAVLVTFDPHPAAVLRSENAPALLTPTLEKLRLLAETGLDAILVLPFTAELSRTSARAFATELLRDRLRAVEVHEGENFRFGYQAEASVEGLTALGRELGFRVQTYDPVQIAGEPVSSSRIRQRLREGRLAEARRLLGRSFSIVSTPASGRGYGSRYTVPTINLAPYAGLLPANGVYVTEIAIGAGSVVHSFEAVTNAGNRPTFGADSFAVESYLLRFEPIELDETTPVRLTFLKRLREERRWPDPEALKRQIGIDVRRAERYFALRRRLA